MSYISNRRYSTSHSSSVIYTDMHGVDFSGDGSGISRSRFAYLENMYRDYEGDGAGVIESIPGFRRITEALGEANGIFSYKNKIGDIMIVIHAGSAIYRLPLSEVDSQEELSPVCSAADSPSRAFEVAGTLYILDGESLIIISDSYCGNAEDSGRIYVPTTYINGEEHEQRNLLTREFCERTVLGDAECEAYGTPEIKYAILDSDALTCAAVGVSKATLTELFVPSRVRIGEREYCVTEISASAFRDLTSLVEVRIAGGVKRIGNLAFFGCEQMVKLFVSDTVEHIGNGAFTDCKKLTTVYLGSGLATIGQNAFSMCTALTEISYGGDETEYEDIEGTGALGERTIHYSVKDNSGVIGIRVHSPTVSVDRVTVGEGLCSYEVYTGEDLTRYVKLKTNDKSAVEGKEICIYGTLRSSSDAYRGKHSGFLASRFTVGKVSEVITGCRIAESFDGRIFLTGNPEYPGVCFYSCRDLTGENNPLYFGEQNYFCDGVGSFGVRALLATGSGLAVFKEGDDGGGSIYYHTPHETGIDLVPKIYPVSNIHSGISAISDAISFFDDPVFVSERGIVALDKSRIELERSIAVRSHNINPRLLSERLDQAKLAVWRGYLAVLIGDHIYLADSRDTFIHGTGDREYEWYYLSGIGSYDGGERVYRYSSTAKDGYAPHPDPDSRAVSTVYSTGTGEDAVCFTRENGVKYEVYPTDEYTGGTFSPAKLLLAVGERLFILTANGTLLLFNNDKRGTIPEQIAELYTEEELDDLRSSLGRRLHPYYYSFENRAARYALVTARDDLGIPHLEKNTVKRSLAIKCRAMSGARVRVEVGTDVAGYSEICRIPGSALDFSDMDFSSLTFSTDDTYTVPVSDKTKGWVEKQISVYSDDFRAPFGLYTVAYRFGIKGRIGKTR